MRKFTIGILAVILLGSTILDGLRCGGDKSTSRPCYTLTLMAQGSGHTEIQPELTCYDDTTHLTLSAQPDTGWTFNNWVGDLTGSNNPATISLSRNSTITATFTQLEYTLSVAVNQPEAGTVTRNPDQATYHYNDIVSLTASPSVNFEFVNWSGDASGTNPATYVTTTGNMSIIANFQHIIIAENEPNCAANYVDNYNGGCNSTPPIFSQIADGQIISGRSGTFTYFGSNYRDTDWYRYVSTGDALLEFKGVGDFYLQLLFIDGTNGCDNNETIMWSTALPGDTADASTYVGPGIYYMWVGPAEFTGWPCPMDYLIWFSVTTVTSIEKLSPQIPGNHSGWRASLSRGDE